MSETVKFIFKCLIKVPVIILVSFAIFNIFAFWVSSNKMIGLSYTVQQVAVENNYIPASERSSLENYMQNELQTDILQSVRFTQGTTFTKQQYGSQVKVGVEANYKFIWPLQPRDMTEKVQWIQ